MIDIYKSNVLLPSRIYEQPKNNDEFKKLVAEYMQKYPHYKVVGFDHEQHLAICERR